MPRLASAPRTGRDTPRSANDSEDIRAYSLSALGRSCDPQRASERREGTEPLGAPFGRPDGDQGSRTPRSEPGGPYLHLAPRHDPEPGPRLAHRDSRGAAGLGDQVVLAIRIALDLELDPRLGADLLPLLGGDVLFAPPGARLARHLAPAGEAVEPAVLPHPGGWQTWLLDLGGERNGHLAAGTGPSVRCAFAPVLRELGLAH